MSASSERWADVAHELRGAANAPRAALWEMRDAYNRHGHVLPPGVADQIARTIAGTQSACDQLDELAGRCEWQALESAVSEAMRGGAP